MTAVAPREKVVAEQLAPQQDAATGAVGMEEAETEAAHLVVVRAPRATLPQVPLSGRMAATSHACHIAWAEAQGVCHVLCAPDFLGVLVDTRSLPADQAMKRCGLVQARSLPSRCGAGQSGTDVVVAAA